MSATATLTDSNNDIIAVFPNKTDSVTPSDTVDNVSLCSVHVNSGGVVYVIFEHDTVEQRWTVVSGYDIIGRVKRILAHDLTASGFIELKQV